MPKKMKVNEKALLKMIQGGATQADVMKKFGFKNSSQLKVAYANAAMSTGQIPALKSGRRTAISADTKITVNKRGSLIIPKALVEKFGLKQGENFDVKNTKTGIRLKKL